ncbi:GH3 auxin-responsive promoter family protein [Bernardetia sp. MNP-M8]|uniref:GH3 auxin-responsive promoter family protein n=1 Tax=Bernardetia sp. MNP-M8 TaxID=3127470 RepID=UPI0030D37B68
MKNIVNWIGTKIFSTRLESIENFKKNPFEVQERVFKYLIESGKDTVWGKEHDYFSIKNQGQFAERIPVSSYEEFYPYIERSLKGEQNLLWNKPIIGFSKSSGTTNARSKYIPVSEEGLDKNHYAAGKDLIALYANNNPETGFFSGKGLGVGGSMQPNPVTGEKNCGDVSALIMNHLPSWAEYLRTPSLEIALMENWEEKMEAMARASSKDNVTSIQGVPTWTLFLIKKILEITGKNSILEVWPNLECFFHGAVSFTPYRQLFKELIPSEQMNYMEVYNASEGFFALQDQKNSEDLLLLLDYGIYYEFIPMEEWDKENPKTITLQDVKLNEKYAMIISTNSGLWRYNIGDVVKFTSLSPFRIRIAGRTKHFINAFGEEVVVENADIALAYACQKTGAKLKDYTAAPIYIKDEGEGNHKQGGHEWIIEFEKQPENKTLFVESLDEKLREINSDYDAKRHANIALVMPTVHFAEPNTFYKWLQSKGKLGGQHKVPRLSNDREYVDAILEVMEK